MQWRDAFNFVSTRKRAYQLVWTSPAWREVLNDLSIFCRANETCVIPNDRDKTLVLEGRREVWLRIQQHLHLTPEQLVALYSGQSITQEENTNG
jgi:hypothetical protein